MKNTTLGIVIAIFVALAAGTFWYYKDTIIDYISTRVTNRVIGGVIGGIATVPLMPLKVFGGGSSNK